MLKMLLFTARFLYTEIPGLPLPWVPQFYSTTITTRCRPNYLQSSLVLNRLGLL